MRDQAYCIKHFLMLVTVSTWNQRSGCRLPLRFDHRHLRSVGIISVFAAALGTGTCGARHLWPLWRPITCRPPKDAVSCTKCRLRLRTLTASSSSGSGFAIQAIHVVLVHAKTSKKDTFTKTKPDKSHHRHRHFHEERRPHDEACSATDRH